MHKVSASGSVFVFKENAIIYLKCFFVRKLLHWYRRMEVDVIMQPHNWNMWRPHTAWSTPTTPPANLRTAHSNSTSHLVVSHLCKHSFRHNMLVIMLIRGWSTVPNESSGCRKAFYILDSGKVWEIFVCIQIFIQHVCNKHVSAHICACMTYEHSVLISSWRFTDLDVCVYFLRAQVISEMILTV